MGLQSFRGKSSEGEAAVAMTVAEEAGATGFALRVADAYGRDDSRIIVQRAGAARIGAGALNLVRALLTDHERVPGRPTITEEGGLQTAVVNEFCNEQVRRRFDAEEMRWRGRNIVEVILLSDILKTRVGQDRWLLVVLVCR